MKPSGTLFREETTKQREEVVKAFPVCLENVRSFFDGEKCRSKKMVLEVHIEFIGGKK